MTIAGMDTLAVANKLKAAGFTNEQAEAVTSVVREALYPDLSSLATKADLAALGAATKADLATLAAATKGDIAALAVATKADLAETKADILKWMITTIGIQTLVIIGSVLALVRMLAH